jgi:hypothetical protein
MYTNKNDKSEGMLIMLVRHIRRAHVFLGGRDHGK